MVYYVVVFIHEDGTLNVNGPHDSRFAALQEAMTQAKASKGWRYEVKPVEKPSYLD